MKGIGTDIIRIKQLDFVTKDLDDPFIQKTYTPKELALILSRPAPLNAFATRFAGKEAVFKSFGVAGNIVRLSEIEILENEVGQPIVILHRNAKAIAKDKDICQVMISLSYDGEYAVAFAVAL